MKGSRSAPAAVAGAVVALGLLLGAPLAAQEGDLAQKQEALDSSLDARAEANREAAAVQDKIDDISDQTDSLTTQYRTALKQIDSIRVYNGQMRELIDSQQKEMASLADQLGRVEIVGRSVTPLMLRMIDSIQRFVQLDVPFLLKERTDRIAKLRKTMDRADVSTAEKFRQIMEAYQIETEYGRTIEAYRDTIEINGRETTVDFLRFGRIALVYQSLDESQRGAWNQEERKWMPLGTEYRSSIRDGLRIARKQSAPDLIRLPLPAAQEAKESS
jgi:septal ring factor EnvC (AmiA/AmiB activator)